MADNLNVGASGNTPAIFISLLSDSFVADLLKVTHLSGEILPFPGAINDAIPTSTGGLNFLALTDVNNTVIANLTANIIVFSDINSLVFDISDIDLGNNIELRLWYAADLNDFAEADNVGVATYNLSALRVSEMSAPTTFALLIFSILFFKIRKKNL